MKTPNLSNFVFLIFAPLILALPLPANAETYSWQTCIDLAAKQNSDLKTAQGQLKSTDALEGSAAAGFFPTVHGTIDAQRSGSALSAAQRLTDLTTGSAIATTTAGSEYTASLSATENIFNGFADYGKVKQAQANTRVSRSALQTALAQLSYDLKSSYQGYLYALDNIKLSAEIIKRREDNLRLVRLHFENGLENKGSVLLSQAYYNDAKFSDLQATHQKEVARTELAHVLGVDDDQKLEVAGEIPVKDPPTATPDLRALASYTPTHVTAVAQVDASRAAVTVAKSGFFPTLNLTGTAARTDDKFFPQNDNWAVGLTLTLPFFDGTSSYYNTKSAQATLFANEEAKTSTDQKLLATLRQAYTAWVEAVERLKVDASYRDAAVTRAEIGRNKYNNGLLTFDEWDIIENDLIARQKAYIQSVHDRVLAEAAWEQALGRGAFN